MDLHLVRARPKGQGLYHLDTAFRKLQTETPRACSTAAQIDILRGFAGKKRGSEGCRGVGRTIDRQGQGKYALRRIGRVDEIQGFAIGVKVPLQHPFLHHGSPVGNRQPVQVCFHRVFLLVDGLARPGNTRLGPFPGHPGKHRHRRRLGFRRWTCRLYIGIRGWRRGFGLEVGLQKVAGRQQNEEGKSNG